MLDQEGDWQEVDQRLVEEGEIEPEPSDVAQAQAAELPVEKAENLYLNLLRMRENYARRYGAFQHAPEEDLAALPEEEVSETEVVDAADALENVGEFDGQVINPENLVIGRNSRNTQAQMAGNSTLAEPAAANNGPLVFAAGNFSHSEFSEDGGATWTNVPLPGGPAEAPILCCDHDVIIDDARRTVFHSALYVNSALSNGVVRIFVRRPINSTTPLCSYTINLAGTNTVPDYPHLGITRQFLYLTINAVGPGGGFARIYRFNLDQMDNCQSVNFSSFTQPFSTFGQRVWVPAEGTNNFTAMYWVQHNSPTVMRIFRWNESNSPQLTAADRTVSSTSFTGPDCRGGIGNFNWITALNASIIGFQKRCTLAAGARDGESVLACYWQAGPTGAITQGHIRAAVFTVPGLSLIEQPHIFNQNICFGFPHVTANKRGDIGITLAAGGLAGGGGSAVRGAVGIDDEFTPGIGRFQSVLVTASGVANRSDGRFGDYFTIHPYEPCEKWFSATNYAWDDPFVNSPADVNYRYVEFGREQSQRCYEANRDQIPVQ